MEYIYFRQICLTRFQANLIIPCKFILTFQHHFFNWHLSLESCNVPGCQRGSPTSRKAKHNTLTLAFSESLFGGQLTPQLRPPIQPFGNGDGRASQDDRAPPEHRIVFRKRYKAQYLASSDQARTSTVTQESPRVVDDYARPARAPRNGRLQFIHKNELRDHSIPQRPFVEERNVRSDNNHDQATNHLFTTAELAELERRLGFHQTQFRSLRDQNQLNNVSKGIEFHESKRSDEGFTNFGESATAASVTRDLQQIATSTRNATSSTDTLYAGSVPVENIDLSTPVIEQRQHRSRPSSSIPANEGRPFSQRAKMQDFSRSLYSTMDEPELSSKTFSTTNVYAKPPVVTEKPRRRDYEELPLGGVDNGKYYDNDRGEILQKQHQKQHLEVNTFHGGIARPRSSHSQVEDEGQARRLHDITEVPTPTQLDNHNVKPNVGDAQKLETDRAKTLTASQDDDDDDDDSFRREDLGNAGLEALQLELEGVKRLVSLLLQDRESSGGGGGGGGAQVGELAVRRDEAVREPRESGSINESGPGSRPESGSISGPEEMDGVQYQEHQQQQQQPKLKSKPKPKASQESTELQYPKEESSGTTTTTNNKNNEEAAQQKAEKTLLGRVVCVEPSKRLEQHELNNHNDDDYDLTRGNPESKAEPALSSVSFRPTSSTGKDSRSTGLGRPRSRAEVPYAQQSRSSLDLDLELDLNQKQRGQSQNTIMEEEAVAKSIKPLEYSLETEVELNSNSKSNNNKNKRSQSPSSSKEQLMYAKENNVTYRDSKVSKLAAEEAAEEASATATTSTRPSTTTTRSVSRPIVSRFDHSPEPKKELDDGDGDEELPEFDKKKKKSGGFLTINSRIQARLIKNKISILSNLTWRTGIWFLVYCIFGYAVICLYLFMVDYTEIKTTPF